MVAIKAATVAITSVKEQEMIYAALMKKTDSALLVGGLDNQPVAPIVAFDSKSDMDEYQNYLWKGDAYEGEKLVRVSRKNVESFFGRDFALTEYKDEAFDGGSSVYQCLPAVEVY